MSKTKVLVCGATGFIGRNVVERLSARDDIEVYGTFFKTQPSGSVANSDKLSLVNVDLTNTDQVNRVIEGKDVVIQAAAVTSGAGDIVKRPYIHVTDNAVMNSILFRACFESKVKHVVFFSCTTMYPSQERPIKEEDFDYHIIDKYFGVGWTKVYMEKMCEFYARLGLVKHTAIRHTNIYGPHDKYDLERSHVFGATMTKVLTADSGTVAVWGAGRPRRDLLHVTDLVRLVELALRKQERPFGLYNAGAGQAVSVSELVQKIIAASGKPLEIQYDLDKPDIETVLYVDTSRAARELGWAPRISLDQGIAETMAWYRENIGG